MLYILFVLIHPVMWKSEASAQFRLPVCAWTLSV